MRSDSANTYESEPYINIPIEKLSANNNNRNQFQNSSKDQIMSSFETPKKPIVSLSK